MAGTLADQALRFTRRRSALRKGVSRGSGAGLEQPERRQVRTVTAANLRISAETAKRFALIITTLTFLAVSKPLSPSCRGTRFRRRRNRLERDSERRKNGSFRPRRESQNNAWETGAAGDFSLPAISAHLAFSNVRFRGRQALYKHHISRHFEKNIGKHYRKTSRIY